MSPRSLLALLANRRFTASVRSIFSLSPAITSRPAHPASQGLLGQDKAVGAVVVAVTLSAYVYFLLWVLVVVSIRCCLLNRIREKNAVAT